MALIYREDWTPGNSLFSTVYRYNRTGVSSEAQDPLYPFMWVAEGVYINGDGMLDKNPAYTGPFDTYQQAGIQIKGAGSLDRENGSSHPGYWSGQAGCIEALYQPTTDSLAANAASYCPLIEIFTGSEDLGVFANLDDNLLEVNHRNEGEHDYNVQILGSPIPVAGQPFKVRLGWQCGTMDVVEEVTAADGFVRIWINDELIYEAVNISLFLKYPYVYNTTPPNMIDTVDFGFAGLIGPLEYFDIKDSVCVTATPLVFTSGKTSSPLVWAKLLLKGAP